MDDTDRRSLDALRLLIRSTHYARADDVPAAIARSARALGATHSRLYVIDYDQLLLVPLDRRAKSRGEGVLGGSSLSVDGSMAGRAYRDVELVSSSGDGMTTMWTPVVNGTERLGVLAFSFDRPEVADGLLDACRDLGSLVADVVLSRNMYGDIIQRARRREQMTIPAEMQWHQLPPLTFVSPSVAVSGVLAPASSVAGDSFDYAVNGETAHVAVVDAMGHGLEATLMSSVAVGTLRNARRSGLDLTDTVRLMDHEVARQFGGDAFVTGVFGELDCATGVWRWVSCGHPPALVVRHGKVIKTLDQVNGLPLGLRSMSPELDIGEEHLHPGDSILLYTDGVVEARDLDDNEFGVPRLVDLVSRETVEGRSAAETMRRLNLAIMDHQEGELQDDATTVLIEWLKPDLRPDTP